MRKLLLFSTLLILITSLGFAQEADQREGYVGENNELIQKNLDFDQLVEVYPNPAIDYLNIDIHAQDLVKVEFEVYDIIGNAIRVAPEKLTANKYRVPVGDLHSGYYMLIVRDPYSRHREIIKFGKQ